MSLGGYHILPLDIYHWLSGDSRHWYHWIFITDYQGIVVTGITGLAPWAWAHGVGVLDLLTYV